MTEESVVRCTVVFRGRVQGVGFRLTTCDVAKSFPVTGYVMNQRDGSVRAVVEGRRQDVSAMIRRVLEVMRDRIAEREEQWGAATGEFDGFTVRYEGR